MTMDKERLMQFLSDAIDMGFDIEVRHIGDNTSKEQAQAMAKRFSSIVGGEVKEAQGEYFNWLTVKSTEGYYHGSFFHNKSEKVTPCNS